MGVGTSPSSQCRWRPHPVASLAVRASIFVVPFATAMVAAYLLSTLIPAASNTLVTVLRWVTIVAVATVAMRVAERLARRLLPLAVLLRLTLVFPDQAPSRLAIALRTGTTRELAGRITAARRGHPTETPAAAAERLLELVGLLSHHDRLTRGHAERVRAYTHLLGRELGLTDAELDKLRWAGLLHDVGKVTVPAEILNKPGPLTEAEHDIVKMHTLAGARLVEPLSDWLGESLRAVAEHHERFDGRGYPNGLAGTDISMAARIVSVADTYDVSTSARSYKPSMPATQARAELAACSGSQFDPVVVRAFLNLSLGRLRLVAGPMAWLAQFALFEPAGVVHASGASAGAAAPAGAVGAGASGAAGVSSMAAGGVSMASVASTTAAVSLGVASGAAGIAVADADRDPAAVTDAAPIVEVDAPAALAADPADEVVVLDEVFLGVPDADVDVEASPTVATDSSLELVAELVTKSTVTELVAEPVTEPTVSSTTLASPSTTTPISTPTVASTSTPTALPTPTSAPPATISAPPTTTASTTTTTTTTSTTTASTTTTTTTATATTTTSTTTTTVPSSSSWFFHGPPGDSEAWAWWAIASTPPSATTLVNLDTDRDAAPGVLIQKDAAGTGGSDLTKVARFTGAVGPTNMEGEWIARLYVAAKDFEKRDLRVQIEVQHCDVSDVCTSISTGEKWARNADRWKQLTIPLRGVDRDLAAGDRLVVLVAALDDSEDDMWLAFGTVDQPSGLLSG